MAGTGGGFAPWYSTRRRGHRAVGPGAIPKENQLMLSRTALLTATVLASAAALVGLGSTTGPGAPPTVHVYQYVQAHHSGKDLAVLNASDGAGPADRPVHAQPRGEPGVGDRRPALVARGRLGAGPSDQEPAEWPVPRHKNNSLAAGAAVVQNLCDVNDPAQRWIVPKLAEIFSPDGGFRHYMNKKTRACSLDVAGLDREQRAGHPVPQPRRHHQPAVPAGLRRGSS